MKRVFVVLALAILVVVVIAAPVLALEGDSTYLDSSGSPHGSYTQATNKCGVCHAVHHATGTEVLLPDDVANACSYCHITTGAGNVRIYSGIVANYSGTDWDQAHNSYDAGASGVKCVGCHQVHGATSVVGTQSYIAQKILNVVGENFQDFPDSADNDTAVTQWCTACHTYYYTGYGETSHIMATVTADYRAANSYPTSIGPAGPIAWTGSMVCMDCHDDGDRNTAASIDASTAPSAEGSFPHYTPGKRFLNSAVTSDGAGSTPATDATADGVCLKCHRDGGTPYTGVGVSY